jgi:hypothetical protein
MATNYVVVTSERLAVGVWLTSHPPVLVDRQWLDQDKDKFIEQMFENLPGGFGGGWGRKVGKATVDAGKGPAALPSRFPISRETSKALASP